MSGRCASCSETAEHYSYLADAFATIETELGLRDGLGSFHPRLARIVEHYKAALVEARQQVTDYEELSSDSVCHQVAFRVAKRRRAQS